MRIEHNNISAVISRSACSGKWIFCMEGDGIIESDELAERRNGTFATRKAAIKAFRTKVERSAYHWEIK